MNPCSPPSVSVCFHQAACSLPASPPPSLLSPHAALPPPFFSFFFFYQTNVIMCVNPASASLVDGINKCKNHKSLCSCLCVCVYMSEKQRVYTCLRAHMVSMCNRCEINKSCCGVESALQIATHLFKKRSCCSAWNVINTADGTFVIQNVFGR